MPALIVAHVSIDYTLKDGDILVREGRSFLSNAVFTARAQLDGLSADCDTNRCEDRSADHHELIFERSMSRFLSVFIPNVKSVS